MSVNTVKVAFIGPHGGMVLKSTPQTPAPFLKFMDVCLKDESESSWTKMMKIFIHHVIIRGWAHLQVNSLHWLTELHVNMISHHAQKRGISDFKLPADIDDIRHWFVFDCMFEGDVFSVSPMYVYDVNTSTFVFPEESNNIQ